LQELVPGSHLRFRTQFEDDVLCSGSRLYGFGGAKPSDGKPSSHAPIPTAKVIRLRPGEALIRNGAQQREPGQIVFSSPLLLCKLRDEFTRTLCPSLALTQMA